MSNSNVVQKSSTSSLIQDEGNSEYLSLNSLNSKQISNPDLIQQKLSQLRNRISQNPQNLENQKSQSDFNSNLNFNSQQINQQIPSLPFPEFNLNQPENKTQNNPQNTHQNRTESNFQPQHFESQNQVQDHPENQLQIEPQNQNPFEFQSQAQNQDQQNSQTAYSQNPVLSDLYSQQAFQQNPQENPQQNIQQNINQPQVSNQTDNQISNPQALQENFQLNQNPESFFSQAHFQSQNQFQNQSQNQNINENDNQNLNSFNHLIPQDNLSFTPAEDNIQKIQLKVNTIGSLQQNIQAKADSNRNSYFTLSTPSSSLSNSLNQSQNIQNQPNLQISPNLVNPANPENLQNPKNPLLFNPSQNPQNSSIKAVAKKLPSALQANKMISKNAKPKKPQAKTATQSSFVISSTTAGAVIGAFEFEQLVLAMIGFVKPS